MPVAIQKSWKGKEWFVVTAPKIFGEKPIGETPSLDPNTLIGRRVEASMIDLTDDASKYYIKMKFRIVGIDGSKAITRFDGLECTRDYVLRMSQRRTRQVKLVLDVRTKDGWVMRVKAINVMNRIVQSSIKKKIRKFDVGTVVNEAKEKNLENFLFDIINGNLQEKIKLLGSKIYPIRFCEIYKIEVFSSPESGRASVS